MNETEPHADRPRSREPEGSSAAIGPAADRVTVVYVMGLWRSGSTILDIVLGNQDSVVSVGELRNLPIVGWGGDAVCACGLPVSQCEFWAGVYAGWVDSSGGERVERLRALQDRFERLRSFPRLIAEQVRQSRGFREYASLLGGLYQSIAKRSGARVVVDSTKYPGRALALLQIPHLDVRLIHLVRDGRAVIWSCLRKPNTDLQGRPLSENPRKVARDTARQWLKVNLACDGVIGLKRPKWIRVRYEDFVMDPARELGRIGSLLEMSTRKLADDVEDSRELTIGHTVAGNRVRLSESVRLRPDLEWMSGLDSADRATFWRTAGWLARRYGYTRA